MIKQNMNITVFLFSLVIVILHCNATSPPPATTPKDLVIVSDPKLHIYSCQQPLVLELNKHCPGFGDDPEQNFCCPSEVVTGTLSCCTEEKADQLAAELNESLWSKVFEGDSSLYVIFLLGIMAIFLGVTMFMCFVHDTCPIYQYRLEKRAHKMREEDSEARRTTRASAGVLPSGRHRQSQTQQYLYHQHPPPARTSTSSHRTTTYGRTAPRDFDDPKPLLSEAPPPYQAVDNFPSSPPTVWPMDDAGWANARIPSCDHVGKNPLVDQLQSSVTSSIRKDFDLRQQFIIKQVPQSQPLF